MSLNKLNLLKVLLMISLTSSYSRASAQSADMNYIQTKTFLDDAGNSFLRHIDYYDKLGFVSETVDVGLNTSATPIVSKMEYDSRMKLVYQWAPVPSSGFNFIGDVEDMAVATYNDDLPFSENEYDDFLELTNSWKPGEAWEDHYVTVNRSVVHEGTVKKYSVNNNGELRENGIYPYGLLTCTTTTDEDGRISAVFSNIYKETILERRIDMNDASNVYDTYYVYDKFGRLCYVLPPMCQECEDSVLSKYWYKYNYDDRGRCIEKQLPGCDSTLYKYDNSDRVIITQDPLLREKSLYRFTLYDELGRIAVQGTCQQYNQGMLNANLTVTFNSGIPGLGGTCYHFVDNSNSSFISNPTIEAAYFYDSYGFFNPTTSGVLYGHFSNLNAMHPSTANLTSTNHSKGYKTGEIIAATNGTYLFNSYFYDEKGRVIEDHHSTLDGKVYKVFTHYSFTNKPTLVEKVIPASSNNPVLVGQPTNNITDYTLTTSYSYNQYNDQLESVSVQCGNNTPVVVSQIAYDELGRIHSNSHPEINDVITYEYDLHGWTTGINGTYFKETLHYADGPNDGNYCYNGNISAITWKAHSDTMYHGYGFLYDNYDRMTNAFYAEGEDVTSPIINQKYDECATYNGNGAITTLQRRGKGNSTVYTTIDDLAYSYDGNKPTVINDRVTTSLNYNGAFEYVDGHTGSTTSPDFEYNSAGMLIKDRDKGINRIKYNDIGLVDSIAFDSGAKVAYTYGLNGEKLKVAHWTDIASTASTTGPIHSGIIIPSNIKTTEYLGGDIEVEGESMIYGKTYKYYFGDGYVRFYPGSSQSPQYYFYSKDHLGNVRSVVTKNPSTNVISEVQQTHYYPFGGIIADLSSGTSVQNKLYNGKELDTSNNLWWYDYGARQYDATRGQFTNFDQHCESYYSTNPLTYCGNNPISRIDPTGMDWYKKTDENDAVSYTWQEGSDDIEGYENIGANHSETFGNVTYNYEQNEMVSMTETVLSPKDWSSQMANSSEKKTMPFGNCFYQAGEMVKKSGATSYDEVSYNISGNDNMQSYIDSQIDCGFSTRVHVDRQNKSNAFDGVGDHWVAISSRTTNFRNNEISYNYYDPGTCNIGKGTSSDNRFIYKNNVWTASAPNNNKYNMVHVRQNRR